MPFNNYLLTATVFTFTQKLSNSLFETAKVCSLNYLMNTRILVIHSILHTSASMNMLFNDISPIPVSPSVPTINQINNKLLPIKELSQICQVSQHFTGLYYFKGP